MATDQTTRLEAATVKAENGSQIVYDFANGPATATVQTASGPIPTLAAKLEEISDTLAISSGIYPTTAAALAATSNGQVFLVYAEDDDDIIYRVYKNQNGTAVDTGKNTISGADLEQALAQASQASNTAQAAADSVSSASQAITLISGSDGLSNVVYKPPIQSGVSRSGSQKLFEYVSVKDFGAKGDGVTDDTNALQSAYNSVCNTGIELRFPAGTYLVKSDKGGRITGDIKIRGAGSGKSIIRYDNYATTNNSFPVFYTDSAIASGSSFDLEGLSIVGMWGEGTDFSEANSLVSVFNFARLQVRNCRFVGSRSGGLVGGNFDFAKVESCVFENMYRDACRIANAKQAIVAGNRFRNICDDSIAVTNDDGNPIIETNSLIYGNTLVDSQGIAALGAKITVISNNNIYRAIHRAILVGQAENTFAEGHTAGLSITVTNNNVVDGFTGTVFSNLSGSGFRAIHVSGKAFASKDTVETAVGGSVVAPWPYLYTKATDQGTAVNAGLFNVSIRGNTISRTLAATSKYSNYGFGSRLSRSGYVDPAISLTDMMLNGVYVQSGGNGLLIDENVVDGCQFNIFVDVGTPASGVSARNFAVRNNLVKNFRSTGIRVNGSGFVEVEGNIIDGDPYVESPLRGTAGGWGSSFLSHQGISFLGALASLSGSISNNTFKNVGIPFVQAGGENYGSVLRRSNKMVCQPSVTGYNAANKGIGFVPKADNIDATVVIEDSDPASATFKQLKNICQTAASALPTSGFYLAGTFLRNTDNSASLGWKRITNGSSHVLGTDWIAV